MTNKSDNHNDKNHNSGKQGFASMDKEKVKEIASKGGHTAHKGENHDHDKSKSYNEKNDHNNKHTSEHDEEHHGKQGFASMPKEQVREIASKGGQASHRGSHNDDDDR
ncbi:MAG: KGG domain-containing protein [Rickettsia endosymbiont of Argas persicus]